MNSSVNRGFASDNNSGIHPVLLKALADANTGHVVAYGDDSYTRLATKKFKQVFGDQAEVFFVLTGTAANVLGLSSVTRSFNAIISAGSSHINVDECGAPEKFNQCKILTVKTPDGKLTPDLISEHLGGFGFEHHVQPVVISISQPTELGTVYTISEIANLAGLAKKYNMYLHMDGARLANAAVYLDLSFRAFTADASVDILSFGGTKNGMLFGESVVFLRPELAVNFKYIRKQGMQLVSKMRYISAQFNTYLNQEIWKNNALHANSMAQYLAKLIQDIPEIKIIQKVQSNAVFAVIPRNIIKPLQEKYFFYVWDDQACIVRWMTSFDTTNEDIDSFVNCIKELLYK